MAGKLTHEQQIRSLERKPDVPKQNEVDTHLSNEQIASASSRRAGMNEEMGTARSTRARAANQETRDHNKHNHQTQEGHSTPEPSPDQEKD